VHTWDGSKWVFTSDWLQADEQIIKPMVKAAADEAPAASTTDSPPVCAV
jgi:branched-chain amino acid transport system substrate-binding protein